MTAFAAAPALASFLGLADVDTVRADQLLAIASDAIRARTQQRIDFVENESVLLDPEPSLLAVFLPELPVVDVASVEQLGRDAQWHALAFDQYDWTSSGVLYRLAGGSGSDWRLGSSRWLARRRSIRVTYSHGYRETPADLSGVALSVAARLYENPLGTTETRLGSFMEQFGTSRQPGVDFTDLENTILDKYAMARVA